MNTLTSCTRFLTPPQQTTFENTVTRGQIAQNEQIILLSQCFQLYPIIILLLLESFHNFENICSKSPAADLLYVGKGYCLDTNDFTEIVRRIARYQQCISVYKYLFLYLCSHIYCPVLTYDIVRSISVLETFRRSITKYYCKSAQTLILFLLWSICRKDLQSVDISRIDGTPLLSQYVVLYYTQYIFTYMRYILHLTWYIIHDMQCLFYYVW